MSFIWEWKSDSGFIQFDKNVQEQLNKGYTDYLENGTSIMNIKIASYGYSIDFSNMLQTNTKTLKKRIIRNLKSKVVLAPIKKNSGVEEEKRLISLLNTNLYTDVDIVLKNKTIKAHKFILSRSEILKKDLSENSVLVLNYEEEIVKKALDLLYGEQTEIEGKDVYSLYCLFQDFDLKLFVDYVLQSVPTFFKKNKKAALETVLKLEEKLREKSKSKFSSDPLKEAIFNLFNDEIFKEKELYNILSQFDNDLKIEMICYIKSVPEKFKFVDDFCLNNNVYPDTKFLTTDKKEFNFHKALLSLDSLEYAKNLKDLNPVNVSSSTFQYIVDIYYNHLDNKEVPNNESQNVKDFFKSIGLENILEKPKYYFAPPKPKGCFFDPDFCSDTVKISDDGKSCTYTGPNGFQAAVLCTYAEEWTIQLKTDSGYLMVGMCNKKMSKSGCNYSTPNGYYLYLGTGGLYSGSSSNQSYTQSSYGVKGTVIKMKYDPIEKTLSYIINGTNLGIAFRGLADDVYPALDFYNNGSVIELIDE